MDITSFVLGYKKGKATGGGGGGGGSMEKGTYLLQLPTKPTFLVQNTVFKYRGECYLMCKGGESSSTSTKHRIIYKIGDEDLTFIVRNNNLTTDFYLINTTFIEYNGLMYIFGDRDIFITFDGSELVEHSDKLGGVRLKGRMNGAVYDGYIYIVDDYSYSGTKYLYRFDGETITQVCSVNWTQSSSFLFVWQDNLYAKGANDVLYCFNNTSNVFEAVEPSQTLPINNRGELVGNEWWYVTEGTFCTYNMETGENKSVAKVPFSSGDYPMTYEYNGMKRCYAPVNVTNTHLTILEVE